MESNLVHLFQANTIDAIGFATSVWRGELRIDIRKYVRGVSDGELIPTAKGISIPSRLFPELYRAIQALSEVMATEKVVAKIEKTSNEAIWIGTNKFEGHQLLYIRTHIHNKQKNEWFPTAKGISIRSHLFPELEQGMNLVHENLRTLDSKK
ncbi:MAG: transcriptional coactivator p15/PC4 family protein [Anaerolineales bacterium]|nr:MAG: transcriptional coactivator p15/PC4 family protein [Anaerolineales bacterium]